MDTDLQSIQQVRTLCEKAYNTLPQLRALTQRQVDTVVEAMVEEGYRAARSLAEMAVQETGFGVVADKTIKNEVATRQVWDYIKSLKTVGVINTSPDKSVLEIAEPVGVIAGIIPVTNPTSTALFKAIIAIKSRNAVVFSPHPRAVKCTTASVELMQKVLAQHKLPREALGMITSPTMKATEELMHHKYIALILATGGTAMVKSAYSSGKPAYGVGPGNVPAFIERTADVDKAIADIMVSKVFDNGTVCASEQSIIVDEPIYQRVVEQFKAHKAYLLNAQQTERVSQALVRPGLQINPKLVGQPAHVIAEAAGFPVPADTSLLVAELDGVGRDYPLSIEKLSPVLAMYRVNGWEAGCERCIELLKFGGIGHTLAIHSSNHDIIMEFALEKPAYRIVVNTPATHGAIGATTNLAPSLTLGCGTFGGNSTSDNIGPQHLINIKRLAFEVRPLHAPSGAKSSAIKRKKLVTEKDVREALGSGKKIKLERDCIVTPAARELARGKDILE